mmetsp:Transcript_19504/g.48808  ORF Transcript_19504/g.48808 Transcript_19504/m.48808 type:complete len:205 (+) Transcript_19504:879-1493(+)
MPSFSSASTACTPCHVPGILNRILSRDTPSSSNMSRMRRARATICSGSCAACTSTSTLTNPSTRSAIMAPRLTKALSMTHSSRASSSMAHSSRVHGSYTMAPSSAPTSLVLDMRVASRMAALTVAACLPSSPYSFTQRLVSYTRLLTWSSASSSEPGATTAGSGHFDQFLVGVVAVVVVAASAPAADTRNTGTTGRGTAVALAE